MPFTKENASYYINKRWGFKDPSVVRNIQVKLTLSKAEYDRINAKAAAHNLSRAELIIRAVDKYDPSV